MNSYILALMLLLQHASPWKDTYNSTANAITIASTENPIFKDDVGFRTAALLVAVSWHESMFKQNATHQANSKVEGIGLFQIKQRDLKFLGLTENQLADPLTNARAAIRLMRRSFTTCASSQVNERLALYYNEVSCAANKQESKDSFDVMEWLLMRRPPVSLR